MWCCFEGNLILFIVANICANMKVTHALNVCMCGMNFYGKIPSENKIYCLDRYLYYL